MDRLETVEKWYSTFSDKIEDTFPNMEGYTAHNNILWLIQEAKRLRTVEQAYQALLSATASQQK